MASLPVKSNSAWTVDEMEAYLADTQNPLRLSVVYRGGPLIVPLWYLLDDTGFWCASKCDSVITSAIGSGAACGLDISDNSIPYRGVRGQGRVSIIDTDGERVLRLLIDRYLPSSESDFARWLLGGVDREVAILIRPNWLTAWDFGSRMRSLTT